MNVIANNNNAEIIKRLVTNHVITVVDFWHIIFIENVNIMLIDNQLKKIDRSPALNLDKTITHVIINVTIKNTLAGVQSTLFIATILIKLIINFY